jgi:hypothetical protein
MLLKFYLYFYQKINLMLILFSLKLKEIKDLKIIIIKMK